MKWKTITFFLLKMWLRGYFQVYLRLFLSLSHLVNVKVSLWTFLLKNNPVKQIVKLLWLLHVRTYAVSEGLSQWIWIENTIKKNLLLNINSSDKSIAMDIL